MMASPKIFNSPSTFLEWDGSSVTEISPAPNASNDSSFYGNFLVLPTGQILFADFFFVSVYNPAETYNPAWAPRIQSAPAIVSRGGSYVFSGHLFNGVSQGAAYGDDHQAATNYPLVRITNKRTGHVFYSRTHDHSSMAGRHLLKFAAVAEFPPIVCALGGVAERLIAPVLKTGRPKGLVSSNLTPSASLVGRSARGACITVSHNKAADFQRDSTLSLGAFSDRGEAKVYNWRRRRVATLSLLPFR